MGFSQLVLALVRVVEAEIVGVVGLVDGAERLPELDGGCFAGKRWAGRRVLWRRWAKSAGCARGSISALSGLRRIGPRYKLAGAIGVDFVFDVLILLRSVVGSRLRFICGGYMLINSSFRYVAWVFEVGVGSTVSCRRLLGVGNRKENKTRLNFVRIILVRSNLFSAAWVFDVGARGTIISRMLFGI